MSLTTNPQQPSLPRLSWGKTAFLTVLLLVGVSLLVLAAIHALAPAPARPDLAKEAREYLRKRQVTPLSEPLTRLLADPGKSLVPTQAHALLGDPAPEFDLEDPSGRRWTLKELTGKGPVVLVFYYGYWCNHCVAQLFALQQDVERFHELGAEVVAVSADPPEQTRERFKRYGKFAFPVLSDPGNKVARAYGVAQQTRGGEDALLHGTFVISHDGVVDWCQCGDEPFTGNLTLLHELARMEGRLPASNSK